MDVSVIVCTYNRCESLRRALRSIASQEMPAGVSWEVVVVDNNSTDDTVAVVNEVGAEFAGRFRYVRETTPGLSAARNAGLQAADGKVVAFTDDDVTVAATWLQRLTANLRDGAWVGAGGKIVAANQFTRPAWLPLEGAENLRGMLALFDLGDLPGDLKEPAFGANMAFRKEMFAKYGKFRTDLGRKPGSLMSNEDTEFGRRLMEGGERLRYEPSAVVYHPVPEKRLTQKYFLDFFFNYGRASIREMKPRPDIAGIPRRYLTMLKIGTVILGQRTVRWLQTLNTERRFYYKGFVWMTVGQIVELYEQRLTGKNAPFVSGSKAIHE